MSAARPAARSIFSRRLAAAVSGPAPSPLLAAAPSTTRTSSLSSSSTPAAAATAPPTCHQFHSSAQLNARRPRFKNVRAAEMGLVNDKKIVQFTRQKFPRYSFEEMAELEKRYSPEQMESLKAGEFAINPRDLTVQGRLRTDPYRMPYIDDFSDIQPIIDRRPRRQPPPDPMARFMNMDEFTNDLVEWAGKFVTGPVTGNLKKLVDFVPKEYKKVAEGEWPGDVRDRARASFNAYIQAAAARGAKGDGDMAARDSSAGSPTDSDILEYILERSAWNDKGLNANSSLAPALPNKVPGVAGLYKNAIDPDDKGMDDTGIYQDLKRRTGMSVQEIMDITVKVLVRRFVTNQTRLGKVQSTAILVIAGNRNGWLGMGSAKSTEPAVASEKAKLLAIRNMRPIRRYENRTIYGALEEKVSGSVVQLFPRPPGFGLRVPHRIFEMCRAAGIQDLSAKITRSRNPLNTVKAAYEALLNQIDPDELARGRGKKLIDVRKVYYGGAVY
ncbi:hypothetical protein B0T17DRAFT_481275 [Bombardia bombarda]|uniref:Small ribosomal subunit protein uS5m n=1 Tax=Bombardia bombarda TaxID=252184 RepID=A0AA39XJE5_9PEZI|nr:hypothetical protein B0T17DRAFT_481275 [Bombardia bombarda]